MGRGTRGGVPRGRPRSQGAGCPRGQAEPGPLCWLGVATSLSCRFGDGYMITVRTKSSQNVKDVVRFFNRNFPEAVLKVGKAWEAGGSGHRPSSL